jgi:hypothetical protein
MPARARTGAHHTTRAPLLLLAAVAATPPVASGKRTLCCRSERCANAAAQHPALRVACAPQRFCCDARAARRAARSRGGCALLAPSCRRLRWRRAWRTGCGRLPCRRWRSRVHCTRPPPRGRPARCLAARRGVSRSCRYAVRCLAGACFARDASDACAHMLCAPPVAAKVRRALSVAIGSGALASRFLGGNGFSVLEARQHTLAGAAVVRACAHSRLASQVHMVPDLRRAYVLWDALPGQQERTERELVRRRVRCAPSCAVQATCQLRLTRGCATRPVLLTASSAVPLRAAVAKLVGLKHTPELHFRRNALTEERRRMESAWQVRGQKGRCARAKRVLLSHQPPAHPVCRSWSASVQRTRSSSARRRPSATRSAARRRRTTRRARCDVRAPFSRCLRRRVPC